MVTDNMMVGKKPIWGLGSTTSPLFKAFDNEDDLTTAIMQLLMSGCQTASTIIVKNLVVKDPDGENRAIDVEIRIGIDFSRVKAITAPEPNTSLSIVRLPDAPEPSDVEPDGSSQNLPS